MADHRKRIERVRAHVAANLASDLSLDALAEVAALSRFHVHRAWRAEAGETLADTVRRERLRAPCSWPRPATRWPPWLARRASRTPARCAGPFARPSA